MTEPQDVFAFLRNYGGRGMALGATDVGYFACVHPDHFLVADIDEEARLPEEVCSYDGLHDPG